MLLVEKVTPMSTLRTDILKGNFAKGRTESLGLVKKCKFQGTAR